MIGTQTALKSTTAGAHAAADKDRAGPSLPFPASDAEYAALPAINGQPQQGDIVAYRILEIAANWAPEVHTHTHTHTHRASSSPVPFQHVCIIDLLSAIAEQVVGKLPAASCMYDK